MRALAVLLLGTLAVGWAAQLPAYVVSYHACVQGKGVQAAPPLLTIAPGAGARIHFVGLHNDTHGAVQPSFWQEARVAWAEVWFNAHVPGADGARGRVAHALGVKHDMGGVEIATELGPKAALFFLDPFGVFSNIVAVTRMFWAAATAPLSRATDSTFLVVTATENSTWTITNEEKVPVQISCHVNRVALRYPILAAVGASLWFFAAALSWAPATLWLGSFGVGSLLAVFAVLFLMQKYTNGRVAMAGGLTVTLLGGFRRVLAPQQEASISALDKVLLLLILAIAVAFMIYVYIQGPLENPRARNVLWLALKLLGMYVLFQATSSSLVSLSLCASVMAFSFVSSLLYTIASFWRTRCGCRKPVPGTGAGIGAGVRATPVVAPTPFRMGGSTVGGQRPVPATVPRSAVQHAAPPSPDLSPRTDGEGERSGDDTEAEEGVLSRRPMQRMEKVRVLLGDGRRMDMIAMYDHHGHLMRNPMDARLAHIYPREHVDVPAPSALMRLPYDTVNAIIEASTGYIIDESSLAPPRRRSRSRGRSSVMSARPTVLPAAQAADVGAGAVDELGMPLRHEASSRPSRRTSMLHHAPTTRAAAAAADADEPVQRELFTSRSHSMESTIFEDEPSALPSSTRGRSSVAYVPGFVEAASTTSVRRRSQGATNRRVSTAAH